MEEMIIAKIKEEFIQIYSQIATVSIESDTVAYSHILSVEQSSIISRYIVKANNTLSSKYDCINSGVLLDDKEDGNTDLVLFGVINIKLLDVEYDNDQYTYRVEIPYADLSNILAVARLKNSIEDILSTSTYTFDTDTTVDIPVGTYKMVTLEININDIN